MDPMIPLKSQINNLKSQKQHHQENNNNNKTSTPKRKQSQDHQSTEKSESKFLSIFIDTPPLKLNTKAQSKYTGCNCRKSKCLKMYCVCFSKAKMCDETCLCDGCKNKTDNMQRSIAINQIIIKDPLAFSKNDDNNNFVVGEACNCKKSSCVKKYCDCYRKGRKCTKQCKCIDCENQSEEDCDQSLFSKALLGKKKVKLE